MFLACNGWMSVEIVIRLFLLVPRRESSDRSMFRLAPGRRCRAAHGPSSSADFRRQTLLRPRSVGSIPDWSNAIAARSVPVRSRLLDAITIVLSYPCTSTSQTHGKTALSVDDRASTNRKSVSERPTFTTTTPCGLRWSADELKILFSCQMKRNIGLPIRIERHQVVGLVRSLQEIPAVFRISRQTRIVEREILLRQLQHLGIDFHTIDGEIGIGREQ